MADQPGQGDPDVAVDKFLAGRAGAGVVMDARARHAGAVAGGGRVVDGEQQVVAREPAQQRPQGTEQQAEGQGAGAAAGGPEGAIGGAEVVGDASGAEPGGDGAAAAGEEGAAEQEQQPGGGAAVEGAGKGVEPGGQKGGQVREWHGRLLGRTRDGSHPSSCPGSRPLSSCASISCVTAIKRFDSNK